MALDKRVSLAIDHDVSQLAKIEGLSMAARADILKVRAEAEEVLARMPAKYPEQIRLSITMPKPEDVCIFRLTPVIVSVLDYTKRFGHADQFAVA